MTNKYTIINPYTNAELAEQEFTPWGEVEQQLNILASGYKLQKKTMCFERADVLLNVVALFKKHKEKLAQLITSDTGKVITESRGELERAIITTQIASEEARRLEGSVSYSDFYPTTKRQRAIIERKPLGLILCITPFNFPLNLVMHKIAPAYAAGNVILFKPAPTCIRVSKAVLELCYEAGMPSHSIQLCVPDIPEMEALVAHPLLDCINFTGGTKTAQAISARSGYTKLLFELGGNDPFIVMPDADLSNAVTLAIKHRFGAAGQRCTASKRFFIHQAVYKEFTDRLMKESQNLVTGDPQKEETVVGPLISEASAKLIEERIQKAVEAGATLLLGGDRKGALLYPTILAQVPEHAELIKEETFGPVIPLNSFDNLDDVILQINSSPYGLQAGLFTYDTRIIDKVFEEVEAGTVILNEGTGYRQEHFPFGGVKGSGIGREGVKYAIQEMMVLKTLVW